MLDGNDDASTSVSTTARDARFRAIGPAAAPPFERRAFARFEIESQDPLVTNSSSLDAEVLELLAESSSPSIGDLTVENARIEPLHHLST